MADVLGKKISELAETTDLAGLYTIGSDRNNQSKKVPLQFVKEAADYANAQGDYAKGVGDTIQGNTGVNEYPAFSSSTQYAAGSVVRYNNKLYRFTVLHPAGAWVGTDAIETSIKAETDVKLTELESKINFSSVSWQDGKFYNSTSLGIGDNASFKLSDVFAVGKGTTIKINTAAAGVPLLVMCDSLGNSERSLITAPTTASTTENTLYEHVIEQDCYVRISYKYVLDGAYVKCNDNTPLRGGLESEIAGLESKIADIDATTDGIQNNLSFAAKVDWETGKFYANDNLAIGDNVSYKLSKPFAVKAGDVIAINSAGAGVPLLAKTDSQGNGITSLITAPTTASATENTLYKHTIKEDCYVRAVYKYAIEGSYVECDGFQSLLSKIADIDATTDGIQNNLSFAAKVDWETGKFYANDNLAIGDNVSYKLSKPFAVKAGDVIAINSAGAGVPLLAKTDSQGNGITSLITAPTTASATENTLYKHTIKEDCYVRAVYKYAIEGSYVEHLQNSIPFQRKLMRIADEEQKHLRILLMGNSYTADSWWYVPHMLKSYGITCEITMYYRGALSLENLVTRWESSDAFDNETTSNVNGTINRQLYYIDTRSLSTWSSLAQKSAKDCVEEGNWDIIMIQQWSGFSVDINTFYPYGPQVLELIRQSAKGEYNLAWNIVCTRPTNDEPSALLEVAKAWCGSEPFTIIIPYGTAIFNARTNDNLATLGDANEQNLWSADGVHIQEGLPKYIASLAVVQTLFDKFFKGLSVMGDATRPTDEQLASWGGNYEKRGASVGINEKNCWLAQKAAILATRFPYETKNIADVATL